MAPTTTHIAPTYAPAQRLPGRDAQAARQRSDGAGRHRLLLLLQLQVVVVEANGAAQLLQLAPEVVQAQGQHILGDGAVVLRGGGGCSDRSVNRRAILWSHVSQVSPNASTATPACLAPPPGGGCLTC